MQCQYVLSSRGRIGVVVNGQAGPCMGGGQLGGGNDGDIGIALRKNDGDALTRTQAFFRLPLDFYFAFILNRFGRSMSDCNESQLGKMTSSGDSVDGFIPNGRSSPLQDNHFPSTSLINGESEEG